MEQLTKQLYKQILESLVTEQLKPLEMDADSASLKDMAKRSLAKMTDHRVQSERARNEGDTDLADLHDAAADSHRKAHKALTDIISGKVKGSQYSKTLNGPMGRIDFNKEDDARGAFHIAELVSADIYRKQSNSAIKR